MFARNQLVGGLAFLLIAPPAGASAPDRIELEPSSKWDIDYGPERCSLVRELGSGNTGVHLQIDSFGGWNSFRVMLVGTVIPHLHGPTGTAQVRLTGDPEDREADTLQGSVGNLSAVSFNLIFAPFTVRPTGNPMSEDDMTRLALEQSRGAPDFDATVDSLAVSPTRTRTLVLKLGNMARPLAAMRTCVDDMFKTWGGDPAVQKSLTRAARPVIRTVWKVQGDYPAAMLLRGTSAYVPVRVSVDGVGNPSKCVVQIEGVDKAFKDSVCDDIMHKFEPALDKDGKPVATIVSTSVLYLVDNSKPERNVD